MAPPQFIGNLLNKRFNQPSSPEPLTKDELIFEHMKDGDSLQAKLHQHVSICSQLRSNPIARKPKEILNNIINISSEELPPGFIHGGDINLFGMELPGKIYTFVGELAKAGSIRELVTIGEKVLLKNLLKGLSGTVFGDVPLLKPEFIYKNADPSTGRLAGMHFQAEILFEGALEGVHDTLQRVFGVEKKKKMPLSIGGFVSATREWTKPLSPEEIELKGVLTGVQAKLGEFITFTSVGVGLTALKDTEKLDDYSRYRCRYGFFGMVDLEIPGSVVPLGMVYSLREEVKGVHVLRFTRNEGSGWINVGGFKGLNLSSVQLVAKFPVKETLKELSFETEAVLQFPRANLNLKGIYSPGQFYLEASVPNISLTTIRQFYSDLTGRTLEPFNHDVRFDDLTFRISPAEIVFTGKTTIDGHTSLSAALKIHRDGISITGSVLDIDLGEITIEQANFDIFVGRTELNTTSRESGFEINGKVKVRDITVSVGLYTEFEGGQEAVWCVYGELETEKDFSLARLAPEVKGSFLDVGLKRMALIASNRDAVNGEFNLSGYPIRRGVQFCAVIDRHIEQLNNVSRRRVGGLVLRAAYSLNGGFSFGILMPAPVTFSLGPSVTSGPISLEIVASKLPQLMFTAPLSIKVVGQKQPLVFTFGLKADALSASGFGQMTNYWINPFGIFNERIKIGPDLALEIGIIYATLAATGAPSKIMFSGGLEIGATDLQLAMAINENPAEQLLKATLSTLSLTDLVTFASRVSRQDIPLPSPNLLAFRGLSFYISTGMSIGKTHYPAGASITGEMEIFGKVTTVECTIGATTKISALFDEVKLGPLLLGGVGDERPQMTIELGLAKQHILVDGRLKILGLDTSIRSVFDILPNPDMRFDITFAFAEALNVEISARVLGARDIGGLAQADFVVNVVLEQDVLRYVNTYAKAHFRAINKALEEGIEAARNSFEEEKKKLDMQLIRAEQTLEAVKIALKVKKKQIKDALEEILAELEEGRLELQKDLENARKEFEAALYVAYQQLEQARIDRAAFVAGATIDLMHARKEFRDVIRSKLFDVRATKEETRSRFGALLDDVENAETETKKAQEALDAAEAELKESIKELDESPFYSRMRLSLEVGHRKAHFSDAQETLLHAAQKLERAQKVLQGSDYQSAIAVKTEKVKELQSAKQAEEVTLKKIETKSEAKRNVYDQKVEVSEKAITNQTAAKKQKEAIRGAEEKLKNFETIAQAKIEALKSKQEALPESPEHKKLQSAADKLKAVKSVSEELEVAKQTITLVEEVDHQSLARTIVGKLDEVVNIRRIELHGSLKDLVEKAQPLKARVQGVIAGRKVDFTIDYGIGQTVEFLRALLRKLWEEIKEGLANGFGFGAGMVIK